MGKQPLNNNDFSYLTIVGGKMVEKVEEGTPWAVKREYETSDGNKWVKFELQYKNLDWIIADVEFKDWDFGEQCIIILQDWSNLDKLTLNTDSRYFADFAKKLPNIKLAEKVTINPFDFETNWKRLTGLSIKQDWEKIENYYWDGTKAINGMPEVSKAEAKKYDKDDWKSFFIKVKKFLKQKVKDQKEDFAWVQEVVTTSDAADVFDDSAFDDGNPPF